MKTQPSRTVPDHPLVPPCGRMSVHRINLFEKLGPGVHRCHWCKKPLIWEVRRKAKRRAIFVDYLDHDRNNVSKQNIIPICNTCNVRRKQRDVAEEYVEIAGIRHRATRRICATCEKEFLVPTYQLKHRPARFCSVSCRSGGEIQPGELFIEVQIKDGRIKRLRATEIECQTCHRKILKETGKKRRFCSVPCAAIGRAVAWKIKSDPGR